MLRHVIMGRYILSSGRLLRVRQVTTVLQFCKFGVHPYILAHTRPTNPISALIAPARGAGYGSRNHPASSLGRRARRDSGAEPPGDSRHAGDHRRVRESADRGPDPELPRRLLPNHPGLSTVAPDAAGSLPADGEGVLYR